jgi:hypothetical protein
MGKEVKKTCGGRGTYTILSPSVYVSGRTTELNARLVGHRSPACKAVCIERTTCSELITVIQVLKKTKWVGPKNFKKHDVGNEVKNTADGNNRWRKRNAKMKGRWRTCSIQAMSSCLARSKGSIVQQRVSTMEWEHQSANMTPRKARSQLGRRDNTGPTEGYTYRSEKEG